VVKKNEIMLFAGQWMELEVIMLSERSQSDKKKYCAVSLMENLVLKKE
jgi:hypothetical protein